MNSLPSKTFTVGQHIYSLNIMGCIEEFPAEHRMPTAHFRVFVAADIQQLNLKVFDQFIESMLSKGMVYFCAWGPGCEELEESVDEEIVYSEAIGNRSGLGSVVMTTSHSNEKLTDALSFFMSAAIPAKEYLETCGSSIVLIIGNDEWSLEAESKLIRGME